MSWFRSKKYGKQILEAARAGKEPLKSIVNTARQEGAEGDDIEEWWDFPEKFRQSITLRENAFRLAMYRQLREEEGKSEEEAAIMVKKTFPFRLAMYRQLREEEGKSEEEAAIMVKKTFPIYGRTGVEEEGTPKHVRSWG